MEESFSHATWDRQSYSLCRCVDWYALAGDGYMGVSGALDQRCRVCVVYYISFVHTAAPPFSIIYAGVLFTPAFFMHFVDFFRV